MGVYTHLEVLDEGLELALGVHLFAIGGSHDAHVHHYLHLHGRERL